MATELTVGALVAAAGEKKQGFLDVPGTGLKLPITIINGTGQGKTVLMTSGIHGSEYTGTEAAIRLAGQLLPEDVRGNIIIVHPVNLPAFYARLQYISPDDGKNLNKEFPGAAAGTVCQKIAAVLATELFPHTDLYLDLHGGDIHESLAPFIMYSKIGDGADIDLARECAKAMGVKYIVGNVSYNSGFGYAASMGIPSILSEIGDRGAWSEEETAFYMEGILNVLKLVKVIQGDYMPNKDFVVMSKVESIFAKHSGCWYPCVDAGQTVSKGDKVGEIKDFFGNVLSKCYAPTDGTVLCKIVCLAINAGDLVCAVGVYE